MVIMWSAPATLNMLATSLAEMGALDLSFLSCREYGYTGITAVTLSAEAILDIRELLSDIQLQNF